MKAYLSRRYRFCASHRLHVDSLSDDRNRLAYGKCNNPFGHGHNYLAQVTFSGPIDVQTGMVTNLADLDAYAQLHLLAAFDHTNLNTLADLADKVPTTENLTVLLHSIFAKYPYARLENVHIEETANNSFDFTGRDLLQPGRY